MTDKALLRHVASTALKTKLDSALAEQLTEIVTEAVLTITIPGEPIDLHMIEKMHMVHRSAADTRLVKGLVRYAKWLQHVPVAKTLQRLVYCNA